MFGKKKKLQSWMERGREGVRTMEEEVKRGR
jgi:hypothetical protein